MATHYIEGNSMFGNWMVFPTTLNIVAGDTVTFLHGGESSASSMVVSNFGAGKWTSTNMLYVYKGGSASATTISTLGNTSDAILVGGVSVTINIASQGDTVPDQFTFNSVTGAGFGKFYESNAVVISGIDQPSPATLTGSGGSFAWRRKTGGVWGAWTTSGGNVLNGDSVQVRVNTSTQENTLTSTTLNIGGVSSTYSVRTGYADHTVQVYADHGGGSFYEYFVDPSPEVIVGQSVKFLHVTGHAPGTIQISDFDPNIWEITPVLSLSPGNYSCLSSKAAGIDNITLLHSSAENSRGAVISVQNVADRTPDNMTFTAASDSIPLTEYVSNTQNITGVNRSIFISVDNGALFSLDGRNWQASGTFETFGLGNHRAMRIRSLSAAGFSSSKTITVNVGNSTFYWTITNRGSPPPESLIFNSSTRAGFSMKTQVQEFFTGSDIIGPAAAPTALSSFLRGPTGPIPDISQNLGVRTTASVGLNLPEYINKATYLSLEQGGTGRYLYANTLGSSNTTLQAQWSLSHVPAGTTLADNPRVGFGLILGASEVSWSLTEFTGSGRSVGMSISPNTSAYSQNNYVCTISRTEGPNVERLYEGEVTMTVRLVADNSIYTTRKFPYSFSFYGP